MAEEVVTRTRTANGKRVTKGRAKKTRDNNESVYRKRFIRTKQSK